jgi:uncharacterized protein YndB with AHSA1/START domain
MTKPAIGIVTYIGASPDRVWQALTDPEVTHRYWFGTRFEADWKVGSPIIWRRDGKLNRRADATPIGSDASFKLYVSSGDQ